MDYLRTLGSAAVSQLVQKSGLNLPFSLGEKITSFDDKTIWTLYDGTKRDDGSPVSVFSFDSNQPPRRHLLPLAKNSLRKLRTIRHPDVLKFVDVVETDTTVFIVTERVQPLAKALQSWSSKGSREREDWLLWGLHRVSVALAFINDSCASTHGNVRVDSIFISPSGEWKLGGFEVLSTPKDEAAVLYTLGGSVPDAATYASPEIKKSGWSLLKDNNPAVADAYALGILLHFVFNPSQPLPSTTQAPTASSRGSIPTSIFPLFKRLLNPNIKARLTPQAFLEMGMSETAGEGSGFFANNRLVKVCSGLDNFSLGSEVDKSTLLRTLRESASSFPTEFASHRVLPSLVSALEFGGASAAAILPLVLQFGKNVAPADYSSAVLAPLVKLFASPDRGVRMALLDQMPEYADKLDNKTVTDKIWPNLQTGFTDTVAVIREATVKSIILLSPKLSDRILNNDLLRHLARMQMDPEPSIRTNACILIGRLGPSLGYNTKQKVLVPAFSRALKDVFVHARVAGLMAFMATIDCFGIEELATKVIPSVSSAMVDKEKLVRDQAFKAVELFVKKLEEHAVSMPETAMSEDTPSASTAVTQQGALVNSAAGAAGALAGWAISSLGKKLVSADMQSTMSAVSTTLIDRPTSAPPPQNGMTGSLGVPSPALSTLSSPASRLAVGGSKVKGMQLGANKASTSAANSVLASFLSAEADADSVGAAWGTDDLMDVNADADDWSAFETAPLPSVVRPQPVLAAGSSFGAIIQPTRSLSESAMHNANGTDGDPWGDVDPELSESKDNAWSIDSQLTYPTLSTQPKISISNPWNSIPSSSSHTSKSTTTPAQRNTSAISQTQSTRPTPVSSPSLDSDGWDTPIEKRVASPAPPSMAGMSKDEKAAEMARRKEERKQRIAQLKEQKKNAAGGGS